MTASIDPLLAEMKVAAAGRTPADQARLLRGLAAALDLLADDPVEEGAELDDALVQAAAAVSFVGDDPRLDPGLRALAGEVLDAAVARADDARRRCAERALAAAEREVCAALEALELACVAELARVDAASAQTLEAMRTGRAAGART
jgi:hypothetical protein